MILKFRQTLDDKTTIGTVGTSRCITMEQIQGVVTAIIYQEKVFEVADVTQEDIIFDLSGQKYYITKMQNITVIMNDSDGKPKPYEISKNEITKKYEMNGSTYDSLKELYYDLSLI